MYRYTAPFTCFLLLFSVSCESIPVKIDVEDGASSGRQGNTSAGQGETSIASGGDWRFVASNPKEESKLRRARSEVEPDYCDVNDRWAAARAEFSNEQSVEPLLGSHSVDRHVFCGDGYRGLSTVRIGRAWEDFAGMYRVIRRPDTTEAEKTVVRGLLAYHCTHRSGEWQVPANYPKYDFCRFATKGLTKQRLGEALKQVLPEMTFVHENVFFLYDRSSRYRAELDQKFAKVEEKYPALREVYVDGIEKGKERFQKMREEHADILDPIGPVRRAIALGEAPPEDCAENLRDLRTTYLKKHPPASFNKEDLFKHRTQHPVGYAVTEALSYCYAHDPHQRIHYQLEYRDALADDGGQKWSELAFIAKTRQELFSKLKEQKGAEAFPGFLRETETLPQTIEKYFVADGPMDIDPVDDRALTPGHGLPYGHEDSDYGDTPKPAPVIQEMERTEHGVKLVFPKEMNYDEFSYCTKEKVTDQIDHWEVDDVTGERRAVYKTRCLEKDTVKGGRKVGVDPVVVPSYQAEVLEKGMQVYVEREAGDPKDSVVVDAWWPDRPHPENLVIRRGIPVYALD